MNVKEFIENSGILEEYVLGQLPETEAQGVECLAKTYPEINEEIKVLQANLNAYTRLYEKQPPAHLKEKIFSQMTFAEEEEEEETAEDEEHVVTVIPLWSKMAIAASILLACTTAWFATQNTKSQDQISSLSSRLEIVEGDIENKSTLLAALQDPANTVVKLKAVEGKPEGLVTVLWNESNAEVALQVNSLPKAPTGKQYQLWIIDDNGPVDMGMIDNDFEDKIQKMKDVPSQPAAFAITLEDEGGVSSPTLEELYVIANV